MTFNELRERCLATTESGLTELALSTELREEYERLVLERRAHEANDDFLIFPDRLGALIDALDPRRDPERDRVSDLEREPALIEQGR